MSQVRLPHRTNRDLYDLHYIYYLLVSDLAVCVCEFRMCVNAPTIQEKFLVRGTFLLNKIFEAVVQHFFFSILRLFFVILFSRIIFHTLPSIISLLDQDFIDLIHSFENKTTHIHTSSYRVVGIPI